MNFGRLLLILTIFIGPHSSAITEGIGRSHDGTFCKAANKLGEPQIRQGGTRSEPGSRANVAWPDEDTAPNASTQSIEGASPAFPIDGA